MSQQQATLPFNQLAEQTFAHYLGNEAVVNVLQDPVKLPQFSYIWGVGYTGKSHLLAALGGVLQQNSCEYFSAPSNQILQHDLSVILPRELQFLLIDDVDLLSGSEQGELALFNIFNHCKSHAIKMVVTASVHAKDAVWQLPDLVSRLSSGLTLGLEPLKGDQSLACITQQFEMNGIGVDEAVMQYLRTHLSSSYPELYQLFTLVAVESLKYKRKVTVPLIKQVIKNNPDKYSLA